MAETAADRPEGGAVKTLIYPGPLTAGVLACTLQLTVSGFPMYGQYWPCL